ncbi:MAG TPA: YeiH family putative sulfate export transporter [Hydrogenothermaceae bacterium]|nr:YeiH family putative sulfate export transporter [Hydrogenothermaceae bacterium]
MANIFPGIFVPLAVAILAMLLASTDFIQNTLHFSSLILAILIGVIIGNIFKFPESFKPGITFALKKILRIAIVFLGFRLTFQNIIEVGLIGLIVDTIMLTGTFLLGIWVSKRIFGLDDKMSYLISSGSSICGASAVLATAPVVKAEMHYAAMAVATVTIFGTISMFIYPIIYKAGLLPGFNDILYGIWVGASVHEVAQVVAAGFAISEPAGNTATIAKLTRVMMLAPLLIILSFYLAKKQATHGAGTTLKDIPIPYFVFGFIAMVGINSLNVIPSHVVSTINYIDGFLLTVAMAAMGMETNINKVKGVGMKPIYAAAVLFMFLLVGGVIVVKLVHNILA